MDGRMPVIAAVKGRRQFPWWGRICIAIERVADLIWVFLLTRARAKLANRRAALMANSPVFWAVALIVNSKDVTQKVNFVG